MKLLIIDTETGGLDPLKHSILSLGAVVWEDGVLGAEFEVLIREENIIAEPKALEVNGIDLETHLGIPPKAAVEMFGNFLVGNFDGPVVLVGGHNTPFDVGFVKRLYGLAGYDLGATKFSHRLTDTMGIARFLRMTGTIQDGKEGLTALLQQFNIPVIHGTRHSALADAKYTGLLLTELVRVGQPCMCGR